MVRVFNLCCFGINILILKDADNSVPQAALGALWSLLGSSSANLQAETKTCKACGRKQWVNAPERQSRKCKIVLTAPTGVFFKRNRQPEQTDWLTLWHQLLWRRVCQPRPSANTTTTSHGSRPRLRLLRQAKEDPTEVGTEPCISRPETHWQRWSEWLKETPLKNRKRRFSTAGTFPVRPLSGPSVLPWNCWVALAVMVDSYWLNTMLMEDNNKRHF